MFSPKRNQSTDFLNKLAGFCVVGVFFLNRLKQGLDKSICLQACENFQEIIYG